ncbi:DNA cytosine methyltransferase [Enterobacter hormaechei]|uniref:DNA cytosine methyltransferase n=1 Tax=Enterobacter cloacae complex TaxID=354276 RepID=UPI0007355DB3|nr:MULTISPECIES: DNA (cytosine-5-)-methyltransferase [Enterobacter cloacae complex]AVG36853.1 DNA (cytosine-5-)-methyltransferase [Enterobacter cloacae complex sp.]MDU3993941.1 DNA (cytosine-5-)-methyltransferase [Enterobacter sp.]HAS0842632.1 DNA (cytosine-5-)-methyltransferase [Enterobacter hormaechei subsp. xiangfangensis]EJY4123811.1 DNA (cytosine-5-)-methyltransferase [Enterobacter asburiae]ELC7391686.1 DNA (cytosine-5-)-methyltransferase [Enterobacter asburiae]
MPTVVSLFSGCGGSDAGVLNAGFNVLMANDILPYARDVYLANHPETDYVLGDVSTIESFPSADLLVGCYPCQGFSQGGVRKADRKINTLYLEFARALRTVKPRAFIVENVSGMVRSNFEHLLKDQFKVFEDAGYRVKSQILNASHYGVAQDRKRIFIVGIRSDFGIDYEFPAATHGDNLQPYTTIRDAIGHMPEWPEGEFYDSDFHWYYLSRNRRQDWEQISKTIVANPRHMPLHPISPTLVKLGPDKWQFTSDARARRFSFREAAHLQGFGDLVFPETERASMNMKYTVVGNAVPPPLFEAVAKALPQELWPD